MQLTQIKQPFEYQVVVFDISVAVELPRIHNSERARHAG